MITQWKFKNTWMAVTQVVSHWIFEFCKYIKPIYTAHSYLYICVLKIPLEHWEGG